MLMFTITSCNKDIENCIEDMSGSYTGTQTCYAGTTYDVVVGQGNETEEVVVNIQGFFGFTGIVDENCAMVINEQTLDFGSYTATVSGTGTFSENNLVLNLNQTVSGSTYNCTFTLNK